MPGTYSVVVSNSAGSVTSANATLTVSPAAVGPAITTQPASQSVTAGSGVTFSVTATGTAPLSYQWRKGGSNISGATSATYSMTNVQAADAGTYSVVVSNSAGQRDQCERHADGEPGRRWARHHDAARPVNR